MRRIYVNVFTSLITFIFILFFGSVSVHALVPYPTFAFCENRYASHMQSVYLPVTMLGQNLHHPGAERERAQGLNSPADIFIDRNDRIFVADRGNNRIVQIDIDGLLIQVIGTEGPGRLRSPEGVFVADNGDIWVADTGNNRVVRFDAEGNYINSIHQPDDVRLQHTQFFPINVALDMRGTLFVLLRGSNEGIMTMSQDGEFLGFFGRNRTHLNAWERFLRIIYTEEQIRTNLNPTAPSPTAMAMGFDGFVYTIVQAAEDGQLRKLNVNSEDMFYGVDFQIRGWWFFNYISLSAVTVTESGMIFATDRSNGMVYIYDNNGDLLIGFGELLFGSNFRIGVFGEPVGIAVNSRYELFVLDRVYHSIHVFSPTDMMLNLIAGVEMNLGGRHEAARYNWEAVLRQNAFLRTANLGLGRIHYRDGDFTTAMQYMRRAMDQEMYSQARWQQRIIVVQRYFPVVTIGLAGLFVFWIVWAKVLRIKIIFTKKIKLPDNPICNWLSQEWRCFKFAIKVLRHPTDTFYNASYEGRGSVFSALVWLVLYVLIGIAELGLTSFSFNRYGLRNFNLLFFLVMNLLPVLVWMLANYLVGVITKGQGRVKGIFISTIYALMPLIIFRIPLAILSQALTLAEVAIYDFFVFFVFAWMIYLQFLAAKIMQGYFLGESVKNVLWMAFVSSMIVIFSAALFGIAMQSYAFLDEFVRELIGFV